ncbi:MAG: hypothetical protein JNL21_36265 [Myxococcales bacterium]|nr:hypothetical protein [Myxococcales bacterium]
MGFFDKVKQFAGGKGMADVVITDVERQPVESASMTFTDSVVKGTMVVTAKEPCQILATKYEIGIRYFRDGQEFNTYVASAFDPEPNTHYSDGCTKFPVDMTPGQTLRQPFMVSEVDLANAMSKNGISDPAGAVASGAVKMTLKCIADVKGSPFDPSNEVLIQLRPS